MTKLSWHSTTTDVLKAYNVSLAGKTALITGGSSGLGAEAARALASIGARVIFTGRSEERGLQHAQAVKSQYPSDTVVFKRLDLASLASIKAFADDFLKTERRLDILICNAGVMACPQSYTKDEFETQIGTNHFGHFALVQRLLPLLQSQDTPSRVIVVSSLAHKAGQIELDDLHYRNRKYGRFPAYGQSKLANILFVKELAHRTGDRVKVFALHPGTIWTNLFRYFISEGSFVERSGRWFASFFLKTVPQGAATHVYAAISPELEQHSGAYLSDCKISQPAKSAQDMTMAARLWDVTEQQIAAQQT